MQSLRSKIIIWLLKNRHLFQGKLKAEVVDENFDVNKFRHMVERYVVKPEKLKKVNIKEVDTGEIRGEWIEPVNCKKDKVLMYIHGGGFISGSYNSHRGHVVKFAKEANIKTFHFDYRLAPEYPFPAALEDCVSAYKYLLSCGIKASSIVVGGESAGGTLTLSLIHALKLKNISLPNSCFSISPVTDLRCLTKSFEYNAKNDIAPINSWSIWTNYYIGDTDPKNPLLSPIFGQFGYFPKTLTCVGTAEIHYEEVLNLNKKLKSANVELKEIIDKNMIHAYPILNGLFPEATNAFKEICKFINE